MQTEMCVASAPFAAVCITIIVGTIVILFKQQVVRDKVLLIDPLLGNVGMKKDWKQHFAFNPQALHLATNKLSHFIWGPCGRAAQWMFSLELVHSHFRSCKGYTLLPTQPCAGDVAMLTSTGIPSEDPAVGFKDFFSGDLPKKFLTLLSLLALSRVGIYIPLPGVDVERFGGAFQSSSVLGHVDFLSGSKLSIFSLGIIPYINASIIIQLIVQLNPWLKKVQLEEGEHGRKKIKKCVHMGALVIAIIQAVGHCMYIRPYVDGFTINWLAQSVLLLVGGSMSLVWMSEHIDKLKLGNGMSLLLFVNIVSSLPASIGAAVKQALNTSIASTLGVFLGSFIALTLGIIYVQEAERRIPIVYVRQHWAKGLARHAYLPFKVNSSGVMPIVFASSLMTLPAMVARFINNEAIWKFASLVSPGEPLYLLCNVVLIAFFNYFYTFLQVNPKDVSEQLSKQGASIPGIRPGKATEEFIRGTLDRTSVLGSAFLAGLALAPAVVESTTRLTVLRGFGGTSLLILVGVAIDMARRVQSEVVMQKYKTFLDDMYGQQNLHRF